MPQRKDEDESILKWPQKYYKVIILLSTKVFVQKCRIFPTHEQRRCRSHIATATAPATAPAPTPAPAPAPAPARAVSGGKIMK